MTTACIEERAAQLNELSINILKEIAVQYIKENMQGPESRASIADLIWKIDSDIAEEFSIEKG